MNAMFLTMLVKPFVALALFLPAAMIRWWIQQKMPAGKLRDLLLMRIG